MPYRICKLLDIDTGHMLSKHPGHCRYPHGHSRRVELVLEADELNANDMVCDFRILRYGLKDFLGTLDHAMLMNTEDPMYPAFKEAYTDHVIGFEGVDPTTEIVARMVFDRVRQFLADYTSRKDPDYPAAPSIRLRRVRVWETSTSWAEYEE